MDDGFRELADRVEVTALAGEFSDAGMMKDFDRLAALFTEDGVWRIPLGGIEFSGREAIRAGIERLQDNWEFFTQTTHPGAVRLEGDAAAARTYIAELGRFRDGTAHQNLAIYHDSYRRTPDGWRFASRVYEVRYLDTSPLAGDPPTRPSGEGHSLT
ncbi:nuclear transport factor 2 family protein [Streptomyces sp. NPDC048172]|uniref:nuclear transport factor 2 family protein n=1 Tax=Streptomyces sp. NPDC048172 TaxID=3365505 RepID=UPI003718F8DD